MHSPKQEPLSLSEMASLSLLRLAPTASPKVLPEPPRHSICNAIPVTSSILHPLRRVKLPFPTTYAIKSPKSVAIRMSYNPTPAPDRLISAAAYTLPFFNSLQYGRYLLAQYPNLAILFEPLVPILGLYRSIPYSSFVAFFALYLGVVRNPIFSHYVRFNSMQAVTLDVLLVVPLLIQRIFSPGRSGLGFRIMVLGYNGLFLFSVLCFFYSLVCCVLGRTPHLPFVADAAGRQM